MTENEDLNALLRTAKGQTAYEASQEEMRQHIVQLRARVQELRDGVFQLEARTDVLLKRVITADQRADLANDRLAAALRRIEALELDRARASMPLAATSELSPDLLCESCRHSFRAPLEGTGNNYARCTHCAELRMVNAP